MRKVARGVPRAAGSPQTTLLSQFGSDRVQGAVPLRRCREPFDYFKPH
jgi:hypothetical protein